MVWRQFDAQAQPGVAHFFEQAPDFNWNKLVGGMGYY
jgi:hypothetical protein